MVTTKCENTAHEFVIFHDIIRRFQNILPEIFINVSEMFMQHIVKLLFLWATNCYNLKYYNILRINLLESVLGKKVFSKENISSRLSKCSE